MTKETIVESGTWLNKRIWEVQRITGSTIFLCELQWSPDLVNEPGCMRRTATVLRIRKRSDGLMYRKGFGTFEPRQKPITILP